MGQKLDLVFTEIRIGLFFDDAVAIRAAIAQAKQLLSEVGDWERRNRLKVYEGLFCVTIRDFKTAAALFLDSISTFTANELFPYTEFVGLTVLTAVVTLDRVTLKNKVIDAPEILAVVRGVPDLHEWMTALYECDYAQYFVRLARLAECCKRSRFLAPHARYHSLFPMFFVLLFS